MIIRGRSGVHLTMLMMMLVTAFGVAIPSVARADSNADEVAAGSSGPTDDGPTLDTLLPHYKISLEGEWTADRYAQLRRAVARVVTKGGDAAEGSDAGETGNGGADRRPLRIVLGTAYAAEGENGTWSTFVLREGGGAAEWTAFLSTRLVPARGDEFGRWRRQTVHAYASTRCWSLLGE